MFEFFMNLLEVFVVLGAVAVLMLIIALIIEMIKRIERIINSYPSPKLKEWQKNMEEHTLEEHLKIPLRKEKFKKAPK